jgi:hypothetical protein
MVFPHADKSFNINMLIIGITIATLSVTTQAGTVGQRHRGTKKEVKQ